MKEKNLLYDILVSLHICKKNTCNVTLNDEAPVIDGSLSDLQPQVHATLKCSLLLSKTNYCEHPVTGINLFIMKLVSDYTKCPLFTDVSTVPV